MKHLLIRIEMEDYDCWLATHYQHAEDRKSYGMMDGPVYRDIDNANAAMVPYPHREPRAGHAVVPFGRVQGSKSSRHGAGSRVLYR
ncbi:MAG: hypothetical protein JOZ87_15540 [Chloroflexi bacterium]|nr:hypothetical protein [Chloroflexota bacterium]